MGNLMNDFHYRFDDSKPSIFLRSDWNNYMRICNLNKAVLAKILSGFKYHDKDTQWLVIGKIRHVDYYFGS